MSRAQLRVLVADDEETIRELMRFILNDQQCDVTMATNGREAARQVDEHPFDLVFMDIMMPVLNGVDAFREIHQRHPELPVVMVSGFGKEAQNLREDALRNGAYKFIPKPFSIADIRRVVDEVRTAKSPSA
jgi:two-component system response regulator PilR (NtrC family)